MFISQESIRPEVELISFYASTESADAIKLEVHALLGNAHVVLGETAYFTDARTSVQSRLINLLSSSRSSGSAEGGGRGFCVGSVAFDLCRDAHEEAQSRESESPGKPFDRWRRGPFSASGNGRQPRNEIVGSRTGLAQEAVRLKPAIAPTPSVIPGHGHRNRDADRVASRDPERDI
ncbi:hypothetical protein [Luteimonas sp. A501]